MAYVPERGDVVTLDFGPYVGHEQGGRRPALLSPASYNGRTGLMLCCPLTRQVKGYPFEVAVRVRREEGVVLSDQVSSMDWRVRKARRIAAVPRTVAAAVAERILTLLPEPGAEPLQ